MGVCGDWVAFGGIHETAFSGSLKFASFLKKNPERELGKTKKNNGLSKPLFFVYI